MKNPSKTIQFPKKTPSDPRHFDDERDDEFDDLLEGWAPLVALREKGDIPALVDYCERMAERYPDDPHWQFELGEAYVLNGEYQRAIDFLTPHYRKESDYGDYHHVILDALFALGKNEDDYDWVQKPAVLRMSKEILDACHDYLTPKRKPRPVADLFIRLISCGEYAVFDEDDLLTELLQDDRFIVEHAKERVFAEVRVRREGQKRRKGRGRCL